MGIFSRLKQIIGEAIHKLIPYKQIEQAGRFESPVSPDMTHALSLWADMYLGRSPWLAQEGMKNLNLAAFICSELSRQVLMEMKWNITGAGNNAEGDSQENERSKYLAEQFKRCTGITLREKLEQGMASGGIVIKPYPMDGNIYFDFTPDWCVVPVAFDGDKHMTDVFFIDKYQDGDVYFTRLERHTLHEGTVTITNRCFRSKTENNIGTECDLSAVPVWAKLEPTSDVHNAGNRLLLGWYRVAASNTTDLDTILGSSVFAKAVGCIKDADEQYSRMVWEFESKETAIDVDPSALLPKREKGIDGVQYEMPRLNKRLFRAVDLGQDGTYNVFDPPIRDASLINGLNNILCRIEDLCGIARGTLSDPNEQAMTATQIMMLRQRTYETIRSNQQALEECLRDTVHAMDVYATALNLAPAGDIDVSFEWDDSVLADTETELDQRLRLQSAGIMSKVEIRMWYLGETRKQAEDAIAQISSDNINSMASAQGIPGLDVSDE